MEYVIMAVLFSWAIIPIIIFCLFALIVGTFSLVSWVIYVWDCRTSATKPWMRDF